MKCLLKEIACVQMGLSFRSRIEPEANGNIRVIQMRDLTEGIKLGNCTNLVTTTLSGINKGHLIRRKDLIFRSRGKTTTATIIDKEIGFAVVSAPLLRIRVASKLVLPEYLCWFINQEAAQRSLHKRATGTAMTMIGKSALDALQVPLPRLEYQERIVALADWSDEEQRVMRDLAKKKEKLVKAIQILMATEPRILKPVGGPKMSFSLKENEFEGPFDSISHLRPESGVYVILGRDSEDEDWKVVDIGQAKEVKGRVETHDRKDCWENLNYAILNYAAKYCSEASSYILEGFLRRKYDPPCGKG